MKKLIFIFVLINIFLSLTAMTKLDIESEVFLKNLMVREAGLYTLLGSKLMVLFNITDELDFSSDGLRNDYEEFLLVRAQLCEDKKLEPLDFKSYREKCRSMIDCKFRQRKNLWNGWRTSEHAQLAPIYKIFSRVVKSNALYGFFVNVPQMIFVLKKHHADFVKVAGMDFDPETIVSSIQEPTHPFWDKVLDTHHLLGLLLGYGEKNAYLFEWMSKKECNFEDVGINRFKELSRLDADTTSYFKREVTIEDLPRPYFVSYDIADPEVERYTKEREKIIAFLKGKDYLQFALNCVHGKVE